MLPLRVPPRFSGSFRLQSPIHTCVSKSGTKPACRGRFTVIVLYKPCSPSASSYTATRLSKDFRLAPAVPELAKNPQPGECIQRIATCSAQQTVPPSMFRSALGAAYPALYQAAPSKVDLLRLKNLKKTIPQVPR